MESSAFDKSFALKLCAMILPLGSNKKFAGIKSMHGDIRLEDVFGWFIAVNVDWLPPTVRTVFEESLTDIPYVPL